MKKTQKESNPSFVRTPATSSHDPRLESMNLGNVMNRQSTGARRRRERQIRQMAVFAGVILVIACAGIWFAIQNGKPAVLSSSSDTASMLSAVENSQDFSLAASSVPLVDSTNPLSDGNITGVDRATAFAALQESVSEYAGNINGRIGVYYINLVNGETWGLNEKAPFVAASSIKLGINTLLYKKVAEGAFKFSDMLSYDNRPYPQGDMETGTGSVIGQPNGTQFSVRRTSQLSITISDNCATNMVIRKLGGIDAIVPYLTAISGEVPYRTPVSYTDYKGAILSGRHRTSAKDLAMYAQNLYQLWKASEKDYEPLMTDLENTVFTFGIQAKLPSTVKVAHKIGTNGEWKTENDAGIVFASEPYVLCVTTENSSQKVGRDAVADISLEFYNYIADVT